MWLLDRQTHRRIDRLNTKSWKLGGRTDRQTDGQMRSKSIVPTLVSLVAVGFCKRGYFHWRKISRKCWQDITLGSNFHDTIPISFIKAYGFYFSRGGNFREEDKSAKNAKITPTRKIPRLQYSWNSLTRSRWDQWKYFELSEVRVKHRLIKV